MPSPFQTTVNRTNPGSGSQFVVIDNGSGNLSQAVVQLGQPVFYNGSNFSVGTSAARMTSSNQSLFEGVTIKASITNTANVYVGNAGVTVLGSNVTTDGFELSPGESITLEINNLNLVYLIAGATNQKVSFIGI